MNSTATGGTATHALLGTWRIVETELWDLDDLDLMEPAYLTLEPRGHGRLGLLAIEATLDYRVVQREGLAAIEFSFEGFDEGDRISGRGWAICVAAWCRGNRELASRVGLLDPRPRDPRTRQSRRG